MPNEFVALTLETALDRAGIPCVRLSNEMPMQPGFNWGAGDYANLLIDAADEQRARAVLEEVGPVLYGEDGACEAVFPPVINLRSCRWLVPVLLCCGGLYLGLISANTVALPLSPQTSDTQWATNIFYDWFSAGAANAIALLISATLLAANLDTVKRIIRHLLLALPALLVLPFWLLGELLVALVHWLERLPQMIDRQH